MHKSRNEEVYDRALIEIPKKVALKLFGGDLDPQWLLLLALLLEIVASGQTTCAGQQVTY